MLPTQWCWFLTTRPNDVVANKIIQKQYPGRKVIGIDVRNLYENGGMVHCVTQQQPAGNLLK
jgi:agmatine deiminase